MTADGIFGTDRGGIMWSSVNGPWPQEGDMSAEPEQVESFEVPIDPDAYLKDRCIDAVSEQCHQDDGFLRAVAAAYVETLSIEEIRDFLGIRPDDEDG